MLLKGDTRKGGLGRYYCYYHPLVQACIVLALTGSTCCSAQNNSSSAQNNSSPPVIWFGAGEENSGINNARFAWAQNKADDLDPPIEVRRNVISSHQNDEVAIAINRYGRPNTTGLDIFRVESSWIRTMQDMLLDLTPYFEDLIPQFEAWTVDELSLDGKLLALPLNYDIGVLYFRNDLLQRYNKSVPETWDELADTAFYIQKKVRQETGNQAFQGFMVPMAKNTVLTYIMMQLIYSHGGGYIVEAGGKITLDNPQALAAFERIKSWIGSAERTDKLQITPDTVLDQDVHQTKIVFLLENAVFTFDFTRLLTEIHDWRPSGWKLFNCGDRTFDTVGVASMPGVTPNMSGTPLWVWGCGVNKYSKNINESLRVLRELASKEFHISMMKNQTASARKDVYFDNETCSVLSQPSVCQLSKQKFIYRKLKVYGDRYMQANRAIYTGTHDFLIGTYETAQEAVDHVKCALAEALEWYQYKECFPEPQKSDGSYLEMHWVIVIVVCSVVFVVGLAVCAWYWYSKHLKKNVKMGNLNIIHSSKIKMMKRLGEGCFGIAYLAKFQNKHVVVKVPRENQTDMAELVAFMNIGDHPNVLNLLGVAAVKDKMCFVTDYCEKGSLDQLHKTMDMSDPKYFMSVARDVSRGLEHLHQEGIIHRDLACRNLFMMNNEQVVIADWGLCVQIDKNDMNAEVNVAGKFPWPWAAPESLRTKTFSRRSDIWMLGVTFYEMLTRGKDPYDFKSGIDTPREIQKGIVNGSKKLNVPKSTDKECKKIMRACLAQNANNRPTAHLLRIMIGDDLSILSPRTTSDPLKSQLESQKTNSEARSNINIDEKVNEADLYNLEGYANIQGTYENTQDTFASLQQIPESASEESATSLKNKQNNQNRDVEMASITGGYSNQITRRSSLAEGKGFPSKSSNYYMSSMYDIALDL